ncbi:MAG: hypothetical protein WKF73_07110, partial [Nocardioidaceae bacterium]
RAQAEADALTERTTALEAADDARAAWFAATAATRDTAERARVELKARGVDPDRADDRVTAQEWLAAHSAEQAAEDPHREVRDEHELTDAEVDTRHLVEQPAAEREATAPILDTAVPDVRDTSAPDATEVADPAQLRRVPTADETAAAVARAQVALTEIESRREADAAREAEDTAQGQRREELARWAEEDRTTEAAQVTEVGDAHTMERWADSWSRLTVSAISAARCRDRRSRCSDRSRSSIRRSGRL